MNQKLPTGVLRQAARDAVHRQHEASRTAGVVERVTRQRSRTKQRRERKAVLAANKRQALADRKRK